jgi:Icc-related predicted phosphoesterase
MPLNVLDYYDYNMPKGVATINSASWTTIAEPSITIQPGTDDCDFVDEITFLVRDDVNLNGNTIRITNWGYGATTYMEATTLQQLIALGDPELYEPVIAYCIATAADENYHKITIKFRPPKYLLSSTVPAESLVVSLEGGGHISAGTIDITVRGWTIEEDNSGIS